MEYFLEIIKMIFKACKDIFLTSFEHFGSFKDALEKYTLTWLNIPGLDREIYFTTMSKKLDPGNISRFLFAFFFFFFSFFPRTGKIFTNEQFISVLLFLLLLLFTLNLNSRTLGIFDFCKLIKIDNMNPGYVCDWKL